MSFTVGQHRVPKGSQKSFHQKRNSDELDVFEARDYFSGANEIYGTHSSPQLKLTRSSGRMSLDNPVVSTKRSSLPAPDTKHEKKYKQLNSPGGKLASLLNSLFYQTSSNKKKSKTSSTQSMKDDDQDHDEIGSRKRSSSISHFRSVNKTSSISEFKKPPPCAPTPTKNSFKYFQSHSDCKPDSTLSKIRNDIDNVHVKSSASHKKVYSSGSTAEKSWLDEEGFEFRTFNEISSEKYNTFVVGVLGDKINHSEDSANLKIFTNDEDDGGDSDSSSDLFELQNYDLICCYSSDLPVYETTRIDDIKGGSTNASHAI